MRRRLCILDYLRALAAIGVVLFHFMTRYNILYGHTDQRYMDFSWGYMGVAAFFLLSAFLTVANMKDNDLPKKWGGRRLIRLYPIYWISMVITFAATKLFLPDRSVSFPSFIVNITMLNEIFGIESVDGAYWTLRYEIIFYFIIFVIMVFNKKDKIKEIVFIWLIVAFMTDIVNRLFSTQNNVNNILLSQYIGVFSVGVTFGEVYRLRSHSWKDVLLILASTIHFGIKNGFHYFIYLLIVETLFWLLIFNEKLQSWVAPKFVHKPLVFVAGISYPLYLTHQNLGYIIISQLERRGIEASISIAIAIISVMAIGYFLDKIDKYILNSFINRLNGGKRV